MSGTAQQPGGKSWFNHVVGDWALQAACRADDVDPDWWFPSAPVNPERSREFWGSDAGRALRVCSRCVVQDDCLQYALRTSERDGIWGGMLPQKRAKIAPPKPDNHDDFATHGTEAGYKRHRRRGEDPCSSCLHGARMASRDRKAQHARRSALAI